MNMILRAANLARRAHEGQKRKYTLRPYIEHPARVAGKVAIYVNATEDMVAAAFMHDVLEDTQATYHEIVDATGHGAATLVKLLTNPSKEHPEVSRAERKAIDRAHLEKAPWEVKVIKMVDRMDNLLELGGSPWDFQLLYAQESIMLAEAIGDVDPYMKKDLVEMATAIKVKAALP